MKIFILLFSSLTLFCGCSSEKKKPMQMPAFAVKVAKVKKTAADLYIDTIGHVVPLNVVDVRSRIEGELTGVYFYEGQKVNKGDLLFTIDPRPSQAKVDQDRATLEEDLAKLKFAEEKVARYAGLVKEEYFSEIDFDQLKTDVSTLKAAVAQDRAQLEKSELDLGYCWIYSPVQGKTGILQINEGNLIAPNDSTPLITINQMEPIYVTFSVPENQLPRIFYYRKQKEMKVRVSYNDLARNYMEGDLNLIDNMVNTKVGMIKIRGIFKNEDLGLWPGQFVKTRLVLTTIPDALLIPFQAVQITSTGTKVFVVKEDNTVESRSVVLGQREDENIIVEKGLKENEVVVVEGQLNLSTGSHVFIPKKNEKKS